MYHHHNTLPFAEAHVADVQRAAAIDTSSTASSRPRHRLRALALGLTAIAALAPAGALAQPPHDLGTPANKLAKAVPHDHSPNTTPGSITFTNPLGRSRGPGAGAGLL
jgi:hypothetical protein